jgi:hypothetical protein
VSAGLYILVKIERKLILHSVDCSDVIPKKKEEIENKNEEDSKATTCDEKHQLSLDINKLPGDNDDVVMSPGLQINI